MRQIQLTTQAVTDPICGMTVDPATAAQQRTHDGTTYYFCSVHCAEQFEQEKKSQNRPVTPTIGDNGTPSIVVVSKSVPAQVEMQIGGSTCASCTITVERTLSALPGVQQRTSTTPWAMRR